MHRVISVCFGFGVEYKFLNYIKISRRGYVADVA
jgi:hypothetical protein